MTNLAPAHQHHLVADAGHRRRHVLTICYLKTNVTGWTWHLMTTSRPNQMTWTVSRDHNLMVVIHRGQSLQETRVSRESDSLWSSGWCVLVGSLIIWSNVLCILIIILSYFYLFIIYRYIYLYYYYFNLSNIYYL